MGEDDIEILLEAVTKGFRADYTATLGDSVRESKKFLEVMTEDTNVIL